MGTVADIVEQHNGRGCLGAPLDVVQQDAAGQEHRLLQATLARAIVMPKELSVVLNRFQVIAEVEVRFSGELYQTLIEQVDV